MKIELLDHRLGNLDNIDLSELDRGSTLSIRDEVHFTVDKAEAEDRTFGLSVARLDVENEEGFKARFFITVRIGANGRPSVVVTAKRSGNKETTKSVTGTYNL